MALMECDSIKAIAPGYINHSATETEISAVEEHLCVCNECRQFLSQLMDKPHEPPKPKPSAAIQTRQEDINDAAAQAIREETKPTSSFGILEYAILGISIIVCLFFIFLLLKK